MQADLRERLGKLLPRLGSSHDGEVIATVAAMRRVLASSGADLHDLVSAIQQTTPLHRLESAKTIRRLERFINDQSWAIQEYLIRIAELERDLEAARAEVSRRVDTPDEQRRRRIIELLADPERSDRSIAREVGCSPTTVGNVRRRQREGGVQC